MDPSATPALSALAPVFATRLAAILRALVALIARAYLRHPRAALIIPRLQRTARVIAALMAGLAAGRAPRPDPRRNRQRPTKPRPKFPTAHGWLLADLKHEAALIRLHLETLLAEPGIADLLAARPHAARLLTPIRHALALTPPPTRPPRPAPPPAPPSPHALSILWPFRTPPPGLRKPP